MCVIIDTCAFDAVFDSKNTKHAEFSPILKWIQNGKGKAVFGGSKYLKEVGQSLGRLKLLGNLEKAGKAVIAPKEIVDELQKKIEKKHKHNDFDDPHIVAIVQATGCKLVCTSEKRCIDHVKKKDLYEGGVRPPKFYRGTRQNQKLFLDKFIVKCCT